MKMKGIAIATASLLATGAYAAQTAKLTGAASAQQRTKVSMLKKKNLKTASSTRTAVATTQAADSVYSTSSSATSTATHSMPGLTTGSSVAKGNAVGAKKKSFVDGIRASIGLEYYGSSIAEPLSGWQTDRTDGGYPQGYFPSELDTRFTLGYQLTDNLQLSYTAYFYSYGDNAEGEKGETFGFQPKDSYLKLGVGKFLKVGKFKWNGDFRVYPGLGKGGNRLPVYLRTGQNFIYSATSRLNLSLLSTLRYYHRTSTAYTLENDASGNAIDFRSTLTPTIEYQLSDKVGSYLGYNMDFSHSYNKGTIDKTEMFKGPVAGQLYYHYFELGASIDFTKAINLNPYIDAYSNAMRPEAMQFGANLAISLL